MNKMISTYKGVNDLVCLRPPEGTKDYIMTQDEARQLYNELAELFEAATIAQLRELVKLAEEFHADVMVATSVRGKEPNFTTANETWLKFSRAARALKGGE